MTSANLSELSPSGPERLEQRVTMMIPMKSFTFYTWNDGWTARLNLSPDSAIRSITLFFHEKMVAMFRIMERRPFTEKNLGLMIPIGEAEREGSAKRISGLAHDLRLRIEDGSFVETWPSMNVSPEALEVRPEDWIHGTPLCPTKEEIDLFLAMGLGTILLWPDKEVGLFFQMALNEGRISYCP